MSARHALPRVLTLAAALCACEIFLRFGGPSVPASYSFKHFLVPDPILGWKLRPGAEGWFGQEGGAHVRINSDGFRDREHTVSKPAGHLRVALLGDSYVEALMVPLEASLGPLLEKTLSACAGRHSKRVEVIQFGVTGYGTAQQLLMLRSSVWKYEPDIVILLFFAGNDVDNNSFRLGGKPYSPYFRKVNDRLVLAEGFPRFDTADLDPPKRDRLVHATRHLAIGRLFSAGAITLLDRISSLLSRRRTQARADRVPALERATVSVFDNAGHPDWEEAWNTTEAILSAMQDEVRRRGAEFYLVLATTGMQVHPDPEVRKVIAERIGEGMARVEGRLLAFSGQKRIAVIDLAPPFRAYALRTGVFLHGFKNSGLGVGHWNEAGYWMAAQYVADRLCRDPVLVRGLGDQ